MELKLSKKQVKEIIEKYYYEQFDFVGKVEMTANLERVGYYEEEETLVRTKITGIIKLMNKDVKVSQEVPAEDIDNAIRNFIEKEGYTYKKMQFDSGIRQRCVGSYMDEHTEYIPYFKGITITIDEKIKKIGGKK